MNFSDFQILPEEQAEEALLRCCGSKNWAKKNGPIKTIWIARENE